MKGTTHIAAGALSALAAYKLGICTQPIEILAGAIITSKLPDIDQKLPLLRHRGQTHSIICPILLYIASGYYSRSLLLGMAIGWISHIIIDLFNGKGIEILYPLSKQNYRIMDIKYNGIIENVLLVLMCVGIIFIIISQYVTIDIQAMIK